jgi:hypothetical protein
MAVTRHVTYLTLVIIFSGGTFLAASFWNLRITGCNSYGYRLNAYISNCSSPHFGDYEHGAIAFELEPETIDAARKSDAVYFGFSFGMVALSTNATESYFRSKNARFYNLGFSGEFSPFYDYILPKLNIRPRIVLIDVEPFFADVQSEAAIYIENHPIRSRIEYMLKKVWQAIQKRSCDSNNNGSIAICGTTFNTFRVLDTGRLIVDYQQIHKKPMPRIPPKFDSEVSPNVKISVTSLAEDFLNKHKIEATCTIMFATPNSFGNQLLAKDVAEGVGANFVNVDVPNIATVDGGHMARDDAERWSAEFWKAADPIIRRCLSH